VSRPHERLAALLIFTVACTSTPQPTPTAVATASQADPTAAVALVLPGAPTSPCRGTSPDEVYRRARGCPITERLEQRAHSSALAGMNPMCRCQSAAQLDVGTATVSGTSATVPVTVRTPTPYVITFALVSRGGQWLVDDTWCGNDQATTIHRDPVVTCGR